MKLQIRKIADVPRMVLVEMPQEMLNEHLQQVEFDIGDAIEEQVGIPALTQQCRAVGISSLRRVIEAGIDVVPTDSPTWFASFGKALEYGELPKVVMVFDIASLEPTYVEVRSDDTAALESLASTHPTRVASQDGSMIWCSRLGDSDPRVTSVYEVEYARWIRGNPRDALLGVVLLARKNDLATIVAALRRIGRFELRVLAFASDSRASRGRARRNHRASSAIRATMRGAQCGPARESASLTLINVEK